MSVTATIGKDHYKTNVLTNNIHRLQADEPFDKGGQDEGPAPEELLAASLAACTCITLRMYADRKQWPLEEVRINVNVHYLTDDSIPVLNLEIKLTGSLDEDQKQRLLIIAGKCPMHKAISNPLVIETKMI